MRFENYLNEKVISGKGKDLITLYHGTTEENLEDILKTGKIKGPVYFTPDIEKAFEYAGGEAVIETKIPLQDVKIDLDLPGGKLLTIEEANNYLNKDWDIDDYLEYDYSLGVEDDIYLKYYDVHKKR